MKHTEVNITRFFSFKRVIIPVLLGLGVAFFLIYNNTDINVFSTIRWNNSSYVWLFFALLMVVFRDFGYILRLRLLTNKVISWKHSLQTIMLWEFASALTPSVVGGSAVAMFIINKENIPLGKSSAIVMITALLDELFYLITVPFVLLAAQNYSVFSQNNYQFLGMTFSSFGLFLVGYGFMFVLAAFISFAVFIHPKSIKNLLLRIFSLKWLRKWKNGALKTGNDLITTSHEMKGKSFFFWTKAFGYTCFSWTSRFLFVNFLILAFIPIDSHLHIYATQMVMWVVMLISPTPGAAGLAEFIFNDFLNVFLVVGLAPVLALFWRFFTYYIYLIVGSLLLPGWFSRVFKKTNISEKN